MHELTAKISSTVPINQISGIYYHQLHDMAPVEYFVVVQTNYTEPITLIIPALDANAFDTSKPVGKAFQYMRPIVENKSVFNNIFVIVPSMIKPPGSATDATKSNFLNVPIKKPTIQKK